MAGFVEAGESLTSAVIREVGEEAGVIVDSVEYLGSQSWPFPYSLMVGFHARLDETIADQQIVPDGIEIEKVRWFTKAEIADGYSTGALILPGRITIARGLIEHWYGGPLDG